MSQDSKKKRERIHNLRLNIKKQTESLFALIQLKDPLIANHCVAVTKYALAIGKELNLEGNELDRLNQAAALHDIGKLLVDDAVIRKRDKLNQREYHQIQAHPEKGMRILAAFMMHESILDAAWHHHERWDGNGYPDGISGETIQLLTRIISIADAIDAMSEDRPYRKHLSDDEIIKELEDKRGTQFDPGLADIAIRLIKENRLR